jgi:acyl-CoA synthetase (AMP-forming)/AMP-acid ligase II
MNPSTIGTHPGTHPQNNVLSYLQLHLSQDPTRPLLYWTHPVQGDQHLQVQDFYKHIMCLAAGLQDLGIQKGDTALVFLPMSAPMYTAMFALQALGAIPVFLDSWARKDDLGPALEIAQCKLVFSSSQGLKWIHGLAESKCIKHWVHFGAPEEAPFEQVSMEALAHHAPLQNITAVESEHTALVTFTTGSTGRPKGADRSHRFLADQHRALCKHVPYLPTDKDLPLFPVFSLNSLASGTPTVLPAVDLAKPAPMDAENILGQIQRLQVTCTTLSPVLFRQMPLYAKEANRLSDLSSLRRVVTGGAPISRAEIEIWKICCPQVEVEVLYGSTEVEPMAHLRGQDLLDRPNSQDLRWVDDGVWVGPIDQDLDWALVPVEMDPSEAIARLGANPQALQFGLGELWVAGAHVCPKYFNDPEASARAKVQGTDAKLWHRTGDVLRMDDDHTLWMIGRVPQRVRSQNGKDLYPVRTEMIARKIEGIRYAAFLELPGPQAVLVLVASQESTSTLLEAKVWDALDHNLVQVDKILWQDSIPLDPRHHSKVEYAKLREQILTGAPQ